jgi:hypothetical protein
MLASLPDEKRRRPGRRDAAPSVRQEAYRMALKTIMFLGLFAFCAAGALVSPILGVLGYCAHYVIGPESQWWAAPVRPWGIRYSFILAATTAVGLALNWRKLRQGQKILTGQEKLLLAFLGIVWLSVLIGQQTVGRYTLAGVDHPSVKFTKVAVFLLMLTHIVTNIRNLDRLIWVLVIGTMFLGMQAWDLPRRAFVKGRLEGIGGPDFSESNFFAVYMATMLWLIGAKFLRSGWPGRIVCFIAGGFTANAVVLTRSRSAVIGLLAGCGGRSTCCCGMRRGGGGSWTTRATPSRRRAPPSTPRGTSCRCCCTRRRWGGGWANPRRRRRCTSCGRARRSRWTCRRGAWRRRARRHRSWRAS